VKLVLENFVDIDISDDRFKDIKLVLVTAQCSRSGVTNPVNYIVNEGEGKPDRTFHANLIVH